MNIKMLKAATAGLVLSVSSFANAGLIPVGIQTDINTSTLTNNGWSLNFQSSWGSQAAHDYEIFSGIALDEYVFIGALDTGTNNIALGAAVLYSDLLNYTSGNNTNDYNGASWYFREDYSMGFAAIGETISLSSADTSSDSGALSKLSWHMHNHHTAGYRVGNYTSNSNGQFQKVVFRTSAIEVPEPTTLAIFGLGLLGLASRRSLLANKK
jgi:hypothetical protein